MLWVLISPPKHGVLPCCWPAVRGRGFWSFLAEADSSLARVSLENELVWMDMIFFLCY